MRFLGSFVILFFALSSHGQSFVEIIKSVAFDRADSDRFGHAVAISGDYAIVGAYSDDFGGADPNMGSAYIFEKEGIADWTFVQKITASDQDDYDRFGWSVAIDGDYVVVGAYREDHNITDGGLASNAGSAYIFERSEAGTWTEVQKIVASDREAGDEFGWSVSISGEQLVVGAHFDGQDETGGDFIYRAGSAYVFERMIDGSWDQTQKIVPSGRAADIDFPGGGEDDDIYDQFGHDLCINGNRMIISAPFHDYDAGGGSPLNETGAAYLFEYSGGTWNEVEKIVNSDRELEDRFGYSVSIDGDYAIVSALTEDDDETGGSSFTNAGSAYIFERDGGGTWSEMQKIVAADRSAGDRFGWDVSISNTQVVIGAARCNTDEDDAFSLSDAGAAYAFELAGGVWAQLNKMDASDRRADDELGFSVAISGTNAIVGAYMQDFDEGGGSEIDNAGAVYFYNQGECTPTSSEQTLTLCEGQTVIVGPFEHSETGTYSDVILSDAGCDSTVTTNLTILPAPSMSQSVSICFGYSYDIGSSSHTTSGEYTDTLSTLGGCDSIVYTSLTVSPENSVSQDITICWGGSYFIGASTYTEAGTYTDILTSSTLCDSTITTHLTIQLPIDNSISQELNLLTAEEDGANYQWVKCPSFEVIPGATDQTYLAPVEGQYAVIVTKGACVDTTACVYVDLLSIEKNTVNAIELYPNPANEYIHIQSGNTASTNELTGKITDPMGRTVWTGILSSNGLKIETNNLPNGIYVFTLWNEEERYRERFVISH